jgi:REP element-mobilizing transposase RayT
MVGLAIVINISRRSVGRVLPRTGWPVGNGWVTAFRDDVVGRADSVDVYWYNLHLVLVVEHRNRFTDEASLRTIGEWCSRIAKKKRYAIATRSVMPDHLHLALRGNIEQSPEETALAMMNNLAFAFGQSPIWQSSYYAGTFGEYDMDAVRRNG